MLFYRLFIKYSGEKRVCVDFVCWLVYNNKDSERTHLLRLEEIFIMKYRNYDEDYDLNSYKKKSKKPKKRKRKVSISKIILTVACSLIALMIAIGVGGYIYLHAMLNRVDREDTDLNVSVNAEAQKKYEDYINIALLGIDSRRNDDEGRSDAIIVLTIDKVHDKIKLTSIARDTYVEIVRNGKARKDKITHAYMYGKAPLAVDTLNRNFELNITDYASINFFGFAEIIDEIGGVWVDVNASERRVMNNKNIPNLRKETGIKCDLVKKTGYQLLSGPQALVYARDRDTGDDVERGSRQREVLAAMFEQVKNLSLGELIDLCGTVLDNCSTSMTNKEMIDIAKWAISAKPTIENLGLPDESCKAYGKTINGTWYYVYDIEFAAKKIHDFILETEETSSKVSSATSK